MDFVELIVCVLAGIGAGFGTGIAGMSAAAVISPMLIAFLHTSPYMAVGIALASDVVSSAVSAYTYHRSGEIDVRNGLWMLFAVLTFTFVGSYIATLVPLHTLGTFSMFATLFMGIKFIVRPVTHPRASLEQRTRKQEIVQSITWGMVIGLICGFVGAGGGMMMLMVLVLVLGYPIKRAVGTSVFIMTFTALAGAVSHFALAREMPDWRILGVCAAVTAVTAALTAKYATKASVKTLNRVLGIGLLILGAVMLGMYYMAR